jgi:ABC-type multidrug transport system permease subunit
VSATFDEQTKLLATAINTVAVAFVILGVVTPLTAVSFGVASAPPPSPWTAFFAAIWLCAGASLHLLARRALRSLKP